MKTNLINRCLKQFKIGKAAETTLYAAKERLSLMGNN